MGCFFGQNMSNENLKIKWLQWKHNKRYLAHLTFFVTLKSTPNKLQNVSEGYGF